MKALVTGSGGFLGRYLVEALVARGDQVRCLARGAYPELDALGVESVRGDAADPAVALAACADREIVFHVAGVPGIWGPWRHYHHGNVATTQAVLAACRQAGVPRFVYTGSPSVAFPRDGHLHLANISESVGYPARFASTYSHTKAIAEQMVLAANSPTLRTASLRPHLLWGPRDRHLIPRILDRASQGKLVRVGTGENRVDLTYVTNAVDAHLLAGDRLEWGSPVCGRAFFVSDDDPVRLWPWIDRLLSEMGISPIRQAVPHRAAWWIGMGLEAAHHAFWPDREPTMTRFLAGQLAGDHYFDIRAAKELLGYRPNVDSETGFGILIDWLRREWTPTSGRAIAVH